MDTNMNNCVNCKKPNPDNWFYCRCCGERSSESKFTINLYMIGEAAKRSDFEISTTTMDKTIERAKKERAKEGQDFWRGKLKEFNKRKGLKYANS